MKILVIMGSPRKGDSYKTVQKIESLMKDAQGNLPGNVEFDYLWLKDAKLLPCRGCHACIHLGEQKCPLKDDTLDILARMQAADGMILATPVYSQQVSYLMKIFIDRYAFLWHRPRLFGKFVIGVAAGGGQFTSTLNYIKECTEAWGCTYVTGLGVPHPDALVPKMRAKLDQDTAKTARRFFDALQSGRVPTPTLGKLIWFRMWRINARACRKDNPTDFGYWQEKGWFEQGYYTGARVNIFKRLAARVIEPFLLRVMRGIYVGY